MTERDTRSRFEDEGIPDLQDGTPQQGWALDPEEAPLPGDEPADLEPLDRRLSREQPDDLGLDEDYDPDAPWPQWSSSAGSAGRLVEEDEGARTDTEKDAVARDAGVDGGGYSVEEDAMYLEPE